MSDANTTTSLDPGKVEKIPSNFVPLREGPGVVDNLDGKRIELVRSAWTSLDDLVRPQNRQIEENVRMLSGQQHAIYHPLLGRWLDVADWMPAEERRWRTRAIFNRLLPWYIINHARATENTPIVTFVPGPDAIDAELSELLDIANKTVWWEANMEDVHDRMMGWVIAAGRGHIVSRIDPTKGGMRPWVGQDLVPMVDPNDQPINGPDGDQLHMMMDNVPFGPDGKPRAKIRVHAPGQHELVQTGEPHATPVGAIVADVFAPMQVRGSWGPEPWHMKRRHLLRSYHTVEEIYDLYQIEVEPTIRGGAVTDVGELERLLFGTGFYGATEGQFGAQIAATNTEGYVELTQLWEAPCNYGGKERTETSPGGRWLVCTPDKVLRDGVRPAAYPYTSPLSTFEFVRIPGRPGGTTPQEALNPVQRAYNDMHSRIKDHVNLSTNPKGVIDAQSGLKIAKFTNAPGENYVLNRRSGVPAIEFVAPPALGEDVYKLMEILKSEFEDIGFMKGAQDPGNPGESGEKLKEARFNTDRFLGPTMRRAAGEYGRMFETWQAIFPIIWDLETTLDYVGDDNIGRTITVYPMLFKEGKVHTRPDVESMLPEGRGEKQEKVHAMYLEGLFGLPGSPEALRKFWELAHMPHLSRAGKPGGVDGTMAEQENGKLLLGTPAEQLPTYEWYDDAAHLFVHERFMKSPEFIKLPQPIKDAFTLHRSAHMLNMQQKAMKLAAMNPAGPGAPGAPGGGPPPAGDVQKGKKDDAAAQNGPPSGRPPLPAPPRGVPVNALPTSPAR